MIKMCVIQNDAFMHFVGTYQFGIDSLDKQQTFNKSILKCKDDDEKTLFYTETMFEIEFTKLAINDRRYAFYRESIK